MIKFKNFNAFLFYVIYLINEYDRYEYKQINSDNRDKEDDKNKDAYNYKNLNKNITKAPKAIMYFLSQGQEKYLIDEIYKKIKSLSNSSIQFNLPEIEQFSSKFKIYNQIIEIDFINNTVNFDDDYFNSIKNLRFILFKTDKEYKEFDEELVYDNFIQHLICSLSDVINKYEEERPKGDKK